MTGIAATHSEAIAMAKNSLPVMCFSFEPLALRRRPAEPVVETGCPKPRAVSRDQGPVVDFIAIITGVLVPDHLARVLNRLQIARHQIAHAHLFRAGDFDDGAELQAAGTCATLDSGRIPKGCDMRGRTIGMTVAWSLMATLAQAQYVGKPGEPWRGAGPQPCFGIDGGANKCLTGPQTIAIRAGRLFDSKNGVLLNNQVVLAQGDRITAVGPAAQIAIPAGAHVVDLSRRTVLPGLIDMH